MAPKPILKIHTLFREGCWVNELGPDSPPISRHDSMEEAIEFGSDYARTRSTEHLVHDRDGLIADQRDFADELTG